jgi:hypothetical protein
MPGLTASIYRSIIRIGAVVRWCLDHSGFCLEL